MSISLLFYNSSIASSEDFERVKKALRIMDMNYLAVRQESEINSGLELVCSLGNFIDLQEILGLSEEYKLNKLSKLSNPSN